MNIDIEALAVEMPRVGAHPNRVPFHGVLTHVDAASQRPPAGARGHRVLLTRAAAEAALPSLIGMALDYTPGLDGHDARRKVGIITAAEIIGRELRIAGYLFGRDFPELVREMKASRLGLSYELADARVEDVRAQVWRLTEVTFTGAAILRREKAAYSDTSILIGIENTGETTKMDKQKTEQLIAVSQRMAEVAEALSATVATMQAQHEELSAKIERIVAAVETEAQRSQSEAEDALRARVAELEAANSDLATANAELIAKVTAGVTGEAPSGNGKPETGNRRKTMPPIIGALLAKSGVEVADTMDAAALDASLTPLSIEQRIAVKSQLAKAGLIV